MNFYYIFIFKDIINNQVSEKGKTQISNALMNKVL